MTWPLKIGHPKGKLVFQPALFRRYVVFGGYFPYFWGGKAVFVLPPIVEMLPPPPNDVFPKPLQATWEPWFRDLFCLEERNFVVLVDRLIQFWHCFLVPGEQHWSSRCNELMNHQQTQSMWIIRSFQNNMYAFVRGYGLANSFFGETSRSCFFYLWIQRFRFGSLLKSLTQTLRSAGKEVQIRWRVVFWHVNIGVDIVTPEVLVFSRATYPPS